MNILEAKPIALYFERQAFPKENHRKRFRNRSKSLETFTKKG